ncbi:uncharacterized protein LOC108033519 [Drosophila biarmipes]|uniref:uncharacterized protein LOC108033519 n=1 Tax=Drosophila biarmipes TaxID=125945 RepID=UPI0007E733FB|nr:uncharacterized protein LOC108033519 [Drosophila biarmipes]
MKGCIFFVVLSLYNLSIGTAVVQSPIYAILCKRTGGSITCYQDNTWGFNEKTRTCYRVRKAQGPCGFFDGKKGCEDFCIKGKG